MTAFPSLRRSAVAGALVLAVLPASAAAHVERSGYWPDPAPDCSVKPCAGGGVPATRSLASALNRRLPGRTRVVCAPNSLTLVKRSIAKARAGGYDIRPTDHRRFSRRAGRRLLSINRRLRRMCRFSEIQPAVFASHNNDRVVIMPGLYTEPTSASKPTHDEACAADRTHSDFGDPGALSYAYQVHCPNDANLISVTGRAIGPGKDPDPALEDRHGVPNVGPCIRCNLQIEGSGVSADDVVIEAGDAAAGNGGPSAVGHRKDVGIHVDRADGFVLRNVTVRHAAEHGIYVLETDGYRLDRFKSYYSGAYGVLTFVEDHGLMENCDAAGHGDSGLYPGAGAKTSAGRDERYYPKARYSQEIRFCDSHHNDGGYSGTDGNAVHVHHNDFYDNALGFTTDVFTAPGHPGFPQQGDLIEHNDFYSNNFNPFAEGSDVKPSIAAPVGTGLWIAGGNDNVIRNNRFWDNRRRGVMLFSAPDATICGPAIGTPVKGCDPAKTTTSYHNSFSGNVMGVAPDGSSRPNGTDFWWDAYPGNTGNCWFGNRAAPGRSVTMSPSPLPDCDGGTDPSSSIGTGSPQNEGELVACLAGFQVSGYPNGNQTACSWTQTPGGPPSSRARIRAVAVPSGDAAASWLEPVTLTTRGLGQYRCRDWRLAGEGLRRGILLRLHRWAGGPVQGTRTLGYGTVLPDATATALFDARCGEAGTGAYMLYRIYGPAAAFAGVAP
ncbi:MAG: right-handed parallel beta-helix repeat-containing protein [Solirubrobacteraceae bacterium]